MKISERRFFKNVRPEKKSMEEEPIRPFENQVGGHTFELQNQGILHQGKCILKQLQDMGRGFVSMHVNEL